MDGSQDPIHQLMEAERNAQATVSRAREAKAQKVKQAHEQAEREVAAFKAQLDSQLQAMTQQSMTDSGANMTRLEQEARGQIAEVKQFAERQRTHIVSAIVERVVNP